MTDDKLIAALRDVGVSDQAVAIANQAADRIAQLTNTHWQVEAMHQNALLHDALTRADAAEAKLAKALDALQLASAELLVIGVMGLHQTALTAADKARAVLAELEKTE